MKTGFYNFIQNNVRGVFTINDDVDMVISVEAESEDIAIEKFKEIIVGENDFCECCGSRFSEDPSSGPTKYPSVYGKRLESADRLVESTDMTGIVYYMDGRKEKVMVAEHTFVV